MNELESLRQEHRDLEQQADDLLHAAEARRPSFEAKAKDFFRDFYRHAVREETDLITPARARGLVGNAYMTELYAEHKLLYNTLGMQLRQALQKNDPDFLVAETRQLGTQLRAHFRKEEALLYHVIAQASGLPG